jgi:phosphoribosylamine---glycine ligase
MSGRRRKVLLLGSGGREHALARALARSPSVGEVVVAPGNAGTRAPATDTTAAIRRAPLPDGLTNAAVVALARAEAPDLVVVGPEAPLCAGVVDALAEASFLALGPTRAAAALEGSKAFLKRFAERHAIPTAPFRVTSSFDMAAAFIRGRGARTVVKADGLCAGKGVVVAASDAEALAASRAMLVDRAFGEAGATVVLEERLAGEEVSVLAVTDGERLFVLPPARDHKRALDGDRGPNTGGMGVVAPSARLSPELLARVEREILRPTLEGMRAEGTPFRGVLFAGLMIAPSGDPMLLEHNVRFGDPECEALMALVDGDVGELFASVAAGRLDPGAAHAVAGRHAAVVVLAAKGYPAAPRSGDRIEGIEAAERVEGVVVHHAGTAEQDGAVVTAGGRVLAVTATGPSAAAARARAYDAAEAIHFDGMHYRRDIGA